MKLQQISIFLENRSGRLAHVTKVLGDAGINLLALALADSSDFGILRLIVSDVDKARQLLQDHGVVSTVTDVLAVEIANRPGGLASLLAIIEAAGVNVEYMYAFAEASTGRAALIFRFDDNAKALAGLQKAGVNVLKQVDLG
ncbi:MAG: ACT domain-containing protein [Lentisphaeria bacterium]